MRKIDSFRLKRKKERKKERKEEKKGKEERKKKGRYARRKTKVSKYRKDTETITFSEIC